MSGRRVGKSARRRSTAALAVMAVVSLSAALLAQFQASNRVNTQVRTEMYGNTGGSIRYGNTIHTSMGSSNYTGTANYQGTANYSNGNSSALLPSEARNAYWRSGALPSDIRMNYAAIGPLAPGGARAYIPEKQDYKPQMTRGNYVNTQLSPQSAPILMSRSAGGGNSDSLRYANMPSQSIRSGNTVVTPVGSSQGGSSGGGSISGGGGQLSSATNSNYSSMAPVPIIAPPERGSIRYGELSAPLAKDPPTTSPTAG